MHRLMFVLAGSLLTSIMPGTAFAFQYHPTPLLQSLAAHELVLVGTVKERAKGQVKVEPVAVIKGRPPGRLLTLPDVWRPGTEFTFGPVPLVEGKTYFLMLHQSARGELSLSKDFAADGVVTVSSPQASLVRTADIAHSLSIQKKEESRKQTLDRAWEKETVETKRRLLEEFLMNPPDPATVPFLLRSMNAGNEGSSLMEMAGLTLRDLPLGVDFSKDRLPRGRVPLRRLRFRRLRFRRVRVRLGFGGEQAGAVRERQRGQFRKRHRRRRLVRRHDQPHRGALDFFPDGHGSGSLGGGRRIFEQRPPPAWHRFLGRSWTGSRRGEFRER